MSLLCPYWSRVLTRAFAREELTAKTGRRLWRHLGRCEHCRGDYNRLMRMQRVWDSPDSNSALPAALEVGLWRNRVVASVQPRKPAVGLWSGILGALAVAAAIVVVVLPPPADELVSRRAHTVGFAVRALCVLPDQVHSLSDDPSPQELAVCPAKGTVHFAARADRDGLVYIMFEPRDGQLQWLWGEEPQTLSFSARLSRMQGVLHESARVYFVFSEEPLDPSLIERAVAGESDVEAISESLGAAVITRRIRYSGEGK